MRVYKLIIAVLSLALSGCVIQSSQLSAVKELFTHKNAAPIWVVNYLDYEAQVYPIEFENNLLFANEYGDKILFDGWRVISVSGIGKYDLKIEIKDDPSGYHALNGLEKVASYTCLDWQKHHSSDGIIYTQLCESFGNRKNEITVSKSGDISRISQIVSNKYTHISLYRLE